MEMIGRKQDMILGRDDLETLFVFKHFPVYMGTTSQNRVDDKYADMKWTISKGSGMIQLCELLPEDELYSVSHNSSFGQVWKEHHQLFADFLHRNMTGEGVLEIGGGNGILNSIYTEKYGKCNWTIVEPSIVKKEEGCKAAYIKAFWDKQFDFGKYDINYDTIVHSHVIEHQYDLNMFMKLNASALKKGERMIFSTPNMKEYINRKYANALNFEHTYYITDDYIEYMLKMYGFGVIEKEYYREDHSIFYATEKVECVQGVLQKDESLKGFYDKNKHAFLDYISYYEEFVEEMNLKLKKTDKKAYLFGAHIFSQLLIGFGLDTSRIECILDNDKLKQGKRLYGTKLMVKSPQILEDKEEPIIILKVAVYADEIREGIYKSVNKSAVFWS